MDLTESSGTLLLKCAFDEDKFALRKLQGPTSREESTSIEDLKVILKGHQHSAETAREVRRKFYTTVFRQDAERSKKEKNLIVEILLCVEEVPVAIPKESNKEPRHLLNTSLKDAHALPQSRFWFFIISFFMWFVLNYLRPKWSINSIITSTTTVTRLVNFPCRSSVETNWLPSQIIYVNTAYFGGNNSSFLHLCINSNLFLNFLLALRAK